MGTCHEKGLQGCLLEGCGDWQRSLAVGGTGGKTLEGLAWGGRGGEGACPHSHSDPPPPLSPPGSPFPAHKLAEAGSWLFGGRASEWRGRAAQEGEPPLARSVGLWWA